MGAAEKFAAAQDRCRTPGSVVLQNWSTSRQQDRDRYLEALVRGAAERLSVRSFDGAKTPEWTSSWSTTGTSINTDIERGGVAVVARSRNLSINNDWARRFLLLTRSNILGPLGMRLQMRLKQRGGKLAVALNDGVEKWWRAWGKRGVCEVTGKHSWRACEALMLMHLVRDGEWLVRYLPGRGPLGFQIQILDPQILDVTYRDTYEGRRIRLGIELDADNKPVAYWLRAYADVSDYAAIGYGDQRRIRVPAAEINHFFVAEEADQLRGFPWIVAGMRRLWLVKDFEEAAAVASSNAAKRVGFFVSPTGEAPAGFADQIVSAAIDDAKRAGRTLSAAEIQTLMESARKFSTAAPGQYDVIPQGYDFKPHDSAYPHINYGQYVKECLRGFTGGVGVSYATYGNNLEAVNYSSANVGIADEREVFKRIQEDFIEAGPDQIFAQALKYGLLAAPQLASFPAARFEEACDQAIWIPRRWAHPDPLKKANSDDINLRNRLTSPQRVITGNGDDPEEIAAEIEAWEKRFGPVGGKTTEGQAALANETEPTDLQDEPQAADGAEQE